MRELPLDTRMLIPIKHLNGARPRRVYVANGGWHRGFRPVIWDFVLPESLSDAAREFSHEMTIRPFQPGVAVDPKLLTVNADLERTSGGVRQEVAMYAGILNSKGTGNESLDSKVTLHVTECVADDGPIPSHWPDKAIPCPLKEYPLPWSGLKGCLTSIYWSQAPGAWQIQYGFFFEVHEPYRVVFDGVRSTIGPLGYKALPGLNDADFRGQSEGTYISVDLKQGLPGEPSKADWTTVSYGTIRREKRGEAPGQWGR